MDGEVKSYAFHQSYDELLNTFCDTDRLALMDAMRRYAFKGIEPEFDNIDLRRAWMLMKPNIESSRKRSAKNSSRSSSGKPSESKSGNSSGKPHGKPESIGTERSGVEKDFLSSGKKESLSRAPDGAAVAGATPPSLPEGWERTGVKCSHAGCDARVLRCTETGSLYCPACDSVDLELMGVIA